MKVFERLSDDEDWEIDSKLSGCRGSINAPESAGDIPAESWPDTFKPEVAERILGYLIDIEEVT